MMNREFYLPLKTVDGSVLYAFPSTPSTCHPVVSIDFAKGFVVVETLQLDSSAVT